MKRNIRFISAGAGSGKTYRLTRFLQEEIASGRVRSEAVIATTFTRKAANELVERVRGNLVESGRLAESINIGQSLIGTVNSICGRLLVRYAFEAGLSPELEVIDQDRTAVLFSQALEQAIQLKDVRMMNGLKVRLSQEDWRKEVRKTVDLARSNDISAAALPAMAIRSIDEFLNYFPTPLDRDLTQELKAALERCILLISENEDTTKSTRKYLTLLRECLRQIEQKRMPWSLWAKLSKTSPAKRSDPAAEPVRNLTLLYDQHPKLHQDIRDWTRLIFELAARAMATYREFKAQRGLMDFIDQEKQLLAVLQLPAVRDSLQQELDLLMVDEFQDTSPIQLALFLELAALADNTIWVGDIKQAIYGFRGSDPTLMNSVVDRLVKDGCDIEILPNSYRSRPQLVHLVNALFVPAFADILSKDQVALTPVYPEQSTRAGVEFWNLAGSNQAKRANALAGGVEQLLEECPQVVDKHTRQLREIKASDIAILSRTHAKARQYAQALADRGITVKLSRPGLLTTPEACLALACLRYLIDPSDTLAGAEIISLAEIPDPEDWLENRLDYINQGGSPYQWGIDGTFTSETLQTLAASRKDMVLLAPTETLELALQVGNVERSVIGWGPSTARSSQRLANLETLRGFAAEYEDECQKERSAGTAGGFLIWLKDLAAAELDERGRDENVDAVHVLTHHTAKGLEWPVVISADLDSGLRSGYWGLSIIDAAGAIDMEHPLENRIIRYWVKPFDRLSAGIDVYDRIASSPLGQADLKKQQAESLRLLYVSLTRPRDLLILPLSGPIEKQPWLNSLNAEWLVPTEGAFYLPSGECITARMLNLAEGTPHQLDTDPEIRTWYPPRKIPVPKPAAVLYPSGLEPITGAEIGRIISLGPRLTLRGKPDMQVIGDALHTILCAAHFVSDENLKKEMITGVLERYHVAAFLETEDVIAMQECFQNKLATELGITKCYPEWPIQSVGRNGQMLKGWVDLVGETEEGLVVIDHKSFPGSLEYLKEKVLSFSGQLCSYKKVIEGGIRNRVISLWIHFAIAGILMEVLPPRRS